MKRLNALLLLFELAVQHDHANTTGVTDSSYLIIYSDSFLLFLYYLYSLTQRALFYLICLFVVVIIMIKKPNSLFVGYMVSRFYQWRTMRHRSMLSYIHVLVIVHSYNTTKFN